MVAVSFTAERDKLIAATYLSGSTIADTAEAHGLTPYLVKKALLRVGVKVRKRGFASMDPAKRREIARMGGAAVPAEKRSFSQSQALAVEAGRKGGSSTPETRRRRAA